MDHNPDDKVGDDYPEDRASHDGTSQPFPFLPPSADKTLKKVFKLEDDDQAPSNPHRQEPDNKPS